MNFTDEQKKRYSRQLALPQIGKQGQEALLDAKVLVVGAGGLGSPVALYLAAAGVGNIGIIDSDRVEISNLQRQILFDSESVGKSKVLEAKRRLEALNPDVRVKTYKDRLTTENAAEIISKYSIIADCSDNFATRFLINDACLEKKKILVSGAVIGFSGQISTYKAFLGEGNPCYRCFCPQIPEESTMPTCITGGILGSVAGVLASLQATEIIKEILEITGSLSGNILIYDGLEVSFRKVKLAKLDGCKCSSKLAKE